MSSLVSALVPSTDFYEAPAVGVAGTHWGRPVSPHTQTQPMEGFNLPLPFCSRVLQAPWEGP